MYKDGDLLSGPATGTVAYMSPEMLKGNPYDKQCDIWSLGVLNFVCRLSKRQLIFTVF